MRAAHRDTVACTLRLPRSLHWLFWDVNAARLDVQRDASFILGRVLEFGRLEDAARSDHYHVLRALTYFDGRFTDSGACEP